MADILPPAPIDSPFASYNWNDWYRKVRDAINSATSVAWSSITGTPTTLAGYGVTAPNIAVATGTSLALTAGISTGDGVLHHTTAPLNNGAAAAAGTLLNAPAAGNPTKWIAIDDNGVTRYIPAW